MVLAVLGFIASLLLGLGVSLNVLKKNIVEVIFSSVGMGFGVTGAIIFIENQLFGIQYSFYNSLALSIVLFLVGIFLIIINRKPISSRNIGLGNIKVSFKAMHKVDFILFIIIIVFYIAVLYKSAFYPSTEWDGVYYHLYTDKWVFEHKTLPTEVGPSYMEYINAYPMLSTWYCEYLMELNGSWNDIIPRLFSPFFAIFTSLLIFHLAMQIGGRVDGALLSVIFFISSPEVAYHSISTYVDISFAFYVILGVYFLYQYENSGNARDIIFSGLFTGFSALAKYNGIIAFAALFIYMCGKSIINRVLKKNREFGLYGIGLLLFSFFAVTAPFYIRNLLVFGDPLYPFLYGFFDGKNLSPYLMEAEKFYYAPTFNIYTFFDILINYPRFVNGAMIIFSFFSLMNSEFKRKDSLSALGLIISLLFFTLINQRGTIWRFFISVFSIFSIFAALWITEENNFPDIEKKQLFLAAIFASINLGIWAKYLSLGIQPRFSYIFISSQLLAITLFLLFKIRYSKPVNKIIPSSNQSLWSVIFVLAVILLLAASGVTVYKIRSRGFLPVSYEESIRTGMGDLYDVQIWINENTPKNAKICTFEDRRYYLEREILPADSYRLEKMYFTNNISAAIEIIQSQGANYILDSPYFRDHPLFAESPVFVNLNNSQFFELLYSKGDFKFYRIK